MSLAVTTKPEGQKTKSAAHPLATTHEQEPDALTGAAEGMPLFLGVHIHRKLAIGSADDPLEHEADRAAEQALRFSAQSMNTAAPPIPLRGTQFASVQRKCGCAGSSGGKCDECRQHDEEDSVPPLIRRKAGNVSASGPAGNQAPSIVHQALRSPGHPLEPSVRSTMERGFARDFSSVRIHTDRTAQDSASSIHAHAYASGDHVVFAAGKYSPDSESGRGLIAHELAHVAQGPQGVQRQPDDEEDDGIHADPIDPESWQMLQHKDGSWREDYEQNVNAATQNALDLEEDLKGNQSPGDAQRELLLSQIRALIRMKAIGLMASNRSHVKNKRDHLLNYREKAGQDSNRSTPLFGAGAGADAPLEMEDELVSSREDISNVQAIRIVAKTAIFLNEKRDKLEDSARAFELESTSQLRAFDDSVQEAYEFMVKESVEYRSPAIQDYLENVGRSLDPRYSSQPIYTTSIIFDTGRHLAEWRHTQAAGAGVALDEIYGQFPFFAQLAPGDVSAEGVSSADVMARIAIAYDDLLSNIDDVTMKIGAEDGVDPFDLPEPVKAVHDGLSPAQQQILDQAMQDRKAEEFWRNLGLTFAQILVVFIPVVGPALAVGIGAGQLIEGVDDALNRSEISSASTNPEGSVLGVTGPGTLEVAMLGVQAALLAADLGGILKEAGLGSPHLSEDGLPLHNQEGLKPGTEVHEQDPLLKHPADIPGSPSEAQLHEEARILNKEMKAPENIRDVLDKEMIKNYDYQVSLEVEGEQHTYFHRRNGGWCRASTVAFCGYAFGDEIEEALEKVRQARRPSATGKPTEDYVQNSLGPNAEPQVPNYEGGRVKGRAKLGMSISDFEVDTGKRTVVEVKNIDVRSNMRTGFRDLRDQVGGYLSNVPKPDDARFWLFLDVRGQRLPPGGFNAILDSVNTGTGHVFDNIFLITEVGMVVY